MASTVRAEAVTPESVAPSKPVPAEAYRTQMGVMMRAQAEDFLVSPLVTPYERKVQLIFTSPPFPLNRKKRYGNLQGEAYVNWLADFAPRFAKLLKPDGSIVMELGNAWEPGHPVMSTLALRALLAFLVTAAVYAGVVSALAMRLVAQPDG